MSYSKRQLYALGEPLGDSATRVKDGGFGRIYGGGGGGGGGKGGGGAKSVITPVISIGLAIATDGASLALCAAEAVDTAVTVADVASAASDVSCAVCVISDVTNAVSCIPDIPVCTPVCVPSCIPTCAPSPSCMPQGCVPSCTPPVCSPAPSCGPLPSCTPPTPSCGPLPTCNVPNPCAPAPCVPTPCVPSTPVCQTLPCLPCIKCISNAAKVAKIAGQVTGCKTLGDIGKIGALPGQICGIMNLPCTVSNAICNMDCKINCMACQAGTFLCNVGTKISCAVGGLGSCTCLPCGCMGCGSVGAGFYCGTPTSCLPDGCTPSNCLPACTSALCTPDCNAVNECGISCTSCCGTTSLCGCAQIDCQYCTPDCGVTCECCSSCCECCSCCACCSSGIPNVKGLPKGKVGRKPHGTSRGKKSTLNPSAGCSNYNQGCGYLSGLNGSASSSTGTGACLSSSANLLSNTGKGGLGALKQLQQINPNGVVGAGFCMNALQCKMNEYGQGCVGAGLGYACGGSADCCTPKKKKGQQVCCACQCSQKSWDKAFCMKCSSADLSCEKPRMLFSQPQEKHNSLHPLTQVKCSIQGSKSGGLPHKYAAAAPKGHHPEFITGVTGYYACGGGTGQSDDIPAMLHDGDYVMDAETVSALGDGSSKAGHHVLEGFRKQIPHKAGGGSNPVPAKIADGEYVFPAAFVTALGAGDNKRGAEILDGLREKLRAHKRSAPDTKIPPKAKDPIDYIKKGRK